MRATAGKGTGLVGRKAARQTALLPLSYMQCSFSPGEGSMIGIVGQNIFKVGWPGRCTFAKEQEMLHAGDMHSKVMWAMHQQHEPAWSACMHPGTHPNTLLITTRCTAPYCLHRRCSSTWMAA